MMNEQIKNKYNEKSAQIKHYSASIANADPPECMAKETIILQILFSG